MQTNLRFNNIVGLTIGFYFSWIIPSDWMEQVYKLIWVNDIAVFDLIDNCKMKQKVPCCKSPVVKYKKRRKRKRNRNQMKNLCWCKLSQTRLQSPKPTHDQILFAEFLQQEQDYIFIHVFFFFCLSDPQHFFSQFYFFINIRGLKIF